MQHVNVECHTRRAILAIVTGSECKEVAAINSLSAMPPRIIADTLKEASRATDDTVTAAELFTVMHWAGNKLIVAQAKLFNHLATDVHTMPRVD